MIKWQTRQLLAEMETSAEGGGSLEYFSFQEDMPEAKISCSSKKYSKAEIVAKFSELADSMFNGGDQQISDADFQALKAKALPQFEKLIGKGTFKVCSGSKSERMAWTTYVAIIGQDYIYSVTVGVED